MTKQRLIVLAVLAVLAGLAARSWILSAVRTTNAMGQFTPPDEKQRRQAIGSTAGLAPRLQRALEPADHFEPIPAPGPSDWLANHPEPGQTYDQFRRERANRPDKLRRKLYLQPLGEFPADTSPSLDQLQQFAEAFFTLPVELRPAVDVSGLPITSRIHPRTRQRQLLTTDILTWLQTRLPEDAYCILAITMADLYPADDWNFVFGQASLRERVGVYSFARYDPGFYGEARGDDARTLILRRSCKVLAHETGHIFGIQHCVYFRCLMNGSNHLDESDDRPVHLCPVCLRKLHHAVGFEIPARYERLRAFSEQARFNDEAAWLTRRLAFLEAGE
jgi:archaemetzincin